MTDTSSSTKPAQYTPGPWQARPTHFGGIIGPRWEVGGSNDGLPVIADIRDNGHNRIHGAANARLIAAAPNLYGRLDVIARWLRRAADALGEAGFTDQAHDLRNQAQWAEADLAKARGEG